MSWICLKCETENPDRLKVCEVCDSPRENLPIDKLKKKYYEAAYKSFIRYHYSLLESADKGCSIDQFKVAEWFYERGGLGASDNCSKIAVSWYLEAAKQGHSDAQAMLASCYEEGRGVPQSRDAAIKWYLEAAKKGDKVAMYKYSKLKYNNKTYEGVIKYRLSLLYSADNGNSDSQFKLGEWFWNHNSQSSYRDEAFIWYTKAAQNGHTGAMYKLGECYEEGKAEIRFYNQAIEWYRKAANTGNKAACLKLGRTYLYGNLMVKKNIAQAINWFRKAGEGINSDDLFNLARAYDTGSDGVSMNKAKAFEYYKKSAEKGHDVAQYNLGKCYQYALGVNKDDTLAEYWYRKAIVNGNNLAKEELDVILKRKIQKKYGKKKQSPYLKLLNIILLSPAFGFCMVFPLGILQEKGLAIPPELCLQSENPFLNLLPCGIILGIIIAIIIVNKDN